jgi:hypothetical protein
VPVFLNSGLVETSWVGGPSKEILELNDMLGGDFDARAVFEISAAMTASRIQYMYPISGYGGGASDLLPTEELEVRALSAVAFGGQFMAIDAIEPDGRVNPAAYESLTTVFDAIRPYEKYGAASPIADVGVYHSERSHISMEEIGSLLTELQPGAPEAPVSPHWLATRGALGAIGDAHLTAAALTWADLDRLDEFAVVVLPNVLRMEHDEVEAFRNYVRGGGRLYASGHTSLLTTDGKQHDDFLLADLFGCHFTGEAPEPMTYLRIASAELAEAIKPIDYVPVGEPFVSVRRHVRAPAPTVLTVTADPGPDVLATVTLPYGGGLGTRDDEQWANIHSTPPWEDTSRPAILRQRFGAGEVVYSTVDLEGAAGRLAARSRQLFVAIVRELLGRRPSFEADAHPNAWTTVFHEPAESRFRLCFLNASVSHFLDPSASPVLPLPLTRFQLACPEGSRFTSLRILPTGDELEFSVDEAGFLEAELRDLKLFEMLAAGYETSG